MAYYECAGYSKADLDKAYADGKASVKHTIRLYQNGFNGSYYSTTLSVDGVARTTIINGGYNVFGSGWTLTI